MIERIRVFIHENLWSREPLRPAPLGWIRNLVQLSIVIGEGFVKDQLLMRSHSLTYLTLLSIVPMLALVATIGDMIGVRGQIIGLIEDNLAAVPDASAYLIGFVEGLDFRQLGAGAGAVLIATTILAIGNGEKAFNAVWGVKDLRPWLRRIPDYLAILVIAPLMLGPALAIRGALESQTLVQRLREVPLIDALLASGLHYLPLLLLVGAFAFVYWFLPNTVVRARSALAGGLVAAVLFTLLQKLFVVVTAGAASRFGAMFGTFASVPIFMIFVYYSWAIILLGAEVSYALQTLPRYRREVRGTPAGAAAREAIGLAIALEVARTFRSGDEPWTTEGLSDELDVPLRTVREVMAELEAAMLVRPLRTEGDPAYQLARAGDTIHVSDVLVALRGPRLARADDSEATVVASEVLTRLESGVVRAAETTTLRDLVDEPDVEEPAAHAVEA